ncbi:alpha/beta hydrolase family protein [Estrella lausannensis]|uniref:PET hydrolase/cutinase-like domain-containing protein n=1 Tax=Estrella lausannensis TaxID=483423 RepID=A0A0H5DP51_9BACT|nr:hypothetical protein [Estrella lausannensis]CRX38271.1 hypothetical protein ELAC_0922 [Estrella lausannensis]
MRALLIFLLIPLYLFAFEIKPVLPLPVLGFQQIAFDDRSISVWYPVAPETEGKVSDDPWDLFKVAPAAKPSLKPPLIVVSHGYMGDPHNLNWLIRGLVDQGFAVAAVRHRDMIDGRPHMNHWMRAVDVSKMLDALEKSSLASSIDFKRIGFAGFSLGGTTGIFLAGGRAENLENPLPGKEYSAPREFSRADEALKTLKKGEMQKDYRERRIRAFFLMAPAWSWIFSDESLAQVDVPVYLIAGAADEILVTDTNAGRFARQIPGAYYQTIPGKVGYFVFITSLSDVKKLKVNQQIISDRVFKDDPSIDRDWIQAKTLTEAVRFFNETFR